MSKIFKWMGSVIVAVTNICLLCGAGYVLDWFNYLFKRFFTSKGIFKRMVSKRLLHVYRQQVNAVKTRFKPGMAKINQVWK
jgi:hypothetical protein